MRPVPVGSGIPAIDLQGRRLTPGSRSSYRKQVPLLQPIPAGILVITAVNGGGR